MTKYVFITGGAGFIGSHTVLEFLQAGFDIIILDNLTNSSILALQRVEAITQKSLVFIEGDINDADLLTQIFADYSIQTVIHFAGLKAVGESVKNPLEYYHNNVCGTLTLLAVMKKVNVKNIVFSSSATVYGAPKKLPLVEGCKLGEPTSPYAASKIMIEQILQDCYRADPSWSIALLRYFNPTGAHESGLLGEDPNGIPNNLVPYIAQVAIGKLEKLLVYGNDYLTIDGTGVRDYIHVVDLAKGHLQASGYLLTHDGGLNIWNLGTSKGYTVLEVIKAFEKVSEQKIPYEIVARRSGDTAECWADCTKANQELGWYAERNLQKMMIDVWQWQKNNPNGFHSD